jgi:hypothetical protein
MIRRPRAAVLALLALVAAGCSPAPRSAQHTPPAAAGTAAASSASRPPLASRPHVILLVLENTEYGSVIGNSAAPSINALAADYGLATQSYARTHPSLPNYLELVAGTTFGITDDCTDCHVEGTTIADQVAAAGYDWRAYMESMPSPCFTGASYGELYARKHDPLIYVDHLRDSPGPCDKIQPFDSFYAALDAATLPRFVQVSPNLCHDGHDCSLRDSDAWVGSFAHRVIASPWFARGGVLIITYDEGTSNAACCSNASGGHIATLVISLSTPPGARMSRPVTHAGVLRTIEELFGLRFLGDAACACSGDLLPLLGRH